MSGLETAIRNALERSDRTDAETRQRIYQSARNALQAGLKRQQIVDVSVVTQQQHRLEALIQRIEREEQDGVDPPEVEAAPFVEPDRAPGPVPDPVASPVLTARRDDDALKADPDAGLAGLRAERDGRGAAAATPPSPRVTRAGRVKERSAPPPRRRGARLLSSFLMVVVTLGLAAGGVFWWADNNGMLQPLMALLTGGDVVIDDSNGQTRARSPLDTADSFSSDWTDVFQAADPKGIEAATAAAVEPLSDEDGARVVLTSRSGGAEGDITIEMPPTVLAALSGKTSTIALTVRAADGRPADFSVECEFGSLGTCGRHRFTVLDERVDMLVKVRFDRSLAPDRPGRLLLNTALSGAPSAVDLFAVRVLPGQ
ncbi:biotin transporter BioY [Ensifer soli]|uniref:biotin transporter BioY n=1 Tax=Ciceribacter sp. sgz301302 TaxID=3342379 RepID=UPI0035B7CCCB